ncbi:hexokinase A [Pichia californica]|uniref:Phosphotransferase n=1 Tax=Pichia californica TaxID=460514 RepID=A0A9P6WPF5_9ASCO|nr:hexokinase A [[Candida] californica]KAG0690764.1 hexokinase A [[Candida] californica]
MSIANNKLQEKITQIHDKFWIPTETLDKIIAYFIEELNRGLKDGTDPLGIPMNISWVVGYPTGEETGDFLALDFGGTNLRVVMVHLHGNKKLETDHSFYKLPHGMRTTKNKDELFEFMASCLEKFLTEKHPTGIPENKTFPLGFTFSYPATQNKIDSGVLQRWTKGFDIAGVEGHDVVPMLMEQINKRSLPIKVVALINDTCGTLVASRYVDPLTEMGCIFGTGVNGAYYELAGDITKLKGKFADDITDDTSMLINCEYGSFDNAHKVIPRTKYDLIIDNASPRPGQQTFEKMTAGFYLGDLIRLILLEVYEEGLLFQNASEEFIKLLNTENYLDTSFLSYIESDETDDLSLVKKTYADALNYKDATYEECYFAKKVAESIGTRAARLSICGISAACKKRGFKKCHIAADGAVYMKYPYFPERAAKGLSDVFRWGDDLPIEQHPIRIVRAQDGSGVGAAVIAALSHNRQVKGLSLGLKDA